MEFESCAYIASDDMIVQRRKAIKRHREENPHIQGEPAPGAFRILEFNDEEDTFFSKKRKRCD